VITRFKLTNLDNYPIKINSIELREPRGQISVVQGKGVVLKPNQSTDIIIESIVFTTKPKIDLIYSYDGYTVSCKKNEGVKSIFLELFPNEVYSIKSIEAKNVMVDEPIEVSVKCTADLNLKVSLWPTDGTIKGSQPIVQNIKGTCNKGPILVGSISTAGVYYIEAELDVPGYSICKTSDCRQGKYISVAGQTKETEAPELNSYLVILIAALALFIVKVKTKK
ncbi:MAG: hypothetical protein QW400_03845, partial [Candidatus Diapherotrites archaeon]